MIGGRTPAQEWEQKMKAYLAAMMLAVSIVLVGSATAEDARIRSIRVSAPDVAKAAMFYEEVFGLTEARRIHRDDALFEVILNYGSTSDNADANPAPRLVLIAAEPGAPQPSVSNLIFGVKDLQAVLARAEAAGGEVSRPPKTSESSGATYAFIRDPAGNEIELIQE